MNKRKIGSEEEQKAAEFLYHNGYRILQTNFYCKAGEIDIIGENEGYLCFIEVKYRCGLKRGYPEEAVDVRKASRITKSALCYMNMKGLSDSTPCRFDVVSILNDDVRLIKNAFDAVM